MPMATTAARIGMTQISEIRPRFGGTTVACGRWSRSTGSAKARLPAAGGIPDEARIEGLRSEHRQHHDYHEEDHSQARLHRHQRLQLHERDDERVHEYVEHRPSPHELDQIINSGAVV